MDSLGASIQTNSSSLASSIKTVNDVATSTSSSLATVTTTLSSAIGNATSSLSASISTTATTLATLSGSVSAEYVLNVTAGNRVAGFRLTNAGGGGNASSFVVQADKFQIVDSSGNYATAPFTVENNTVYITNANIQSLNVGKLTAGSLGIQMGLGSGGVISSGQTAFNTGTGFWLAGGTTPVFSIGNSAGNYMAWNGTNLTISGNITVTGGNAATQTYASNAAGTAENNAKGYADGVASSAQAAAIAAAALDATSKANTVDAKVFTDANGKITKAPTTNSSGLFLGQTNMGYYNGSGWITYMNNSGHFFLNGSGANSLYWDGSELAIQGKIKATSGYIGGTSGFSINSTYIANGKTSLADANAGVYVGTDGISLGVSDKFKVTSTGVLTSTSGTIGGWTLGASTLTGGSVTIDAAGNIRSGQTAYNTGDGFWIGNTGGTKLSIGNGGNGGNKLKWTGERLEVNGGFYITDTVGIRRVDDTNVLTITGGSGNATGGQIDLVGNGAAGSEAGIVQIIAGNVGTGDIYLKTGGDNYRMTVQNDGKIGFFTPSPTRQWEVNSTGYFSGEVTAASFNSNGNIKLSGYLERATANGYTPNMLGSHYIAFGWIDDSLKLNIDSGGGIWTIAREGTSPTFNSVNTTSSERYKKNIRNLTNSLDIVQDLSPKIYDRKDGSKTDEMGLIAEEVYKVIPNIVCKNKDDSIEGLDYSKLVPVLLGAIKELKSRVEQLENK